jgi:hypothetical protein
LEVASLIAETKKQENHANKKKVDAQIKNKASLPIPQNTGVMTCSITPE